MPQVVEMGKQKKLPEVGQILYDQDTDEAGQVVRECLFFIDSPSDNDKQWWVTWLAQMEDYGDGLEVYIQPEAGGMPPKMARIATDEDIKRFVEVLKKESDGIQKLKKWLNLIKTSQDLEPLRDDEKARLIKIIMEALG